MEDESNLKDKPKPSFELQNLDFFKNHKMPGVPKNITDFKIDDMSSFGKKIKRGFKS